METSCSLLVLQNILPEERTVPQVLSKASVQRGRGKEVALSKLAGDKQAFTLGRFRFSKDTKD